MAGPEVFTRFAMLGGLVGREHETTLVDTLVTERGGSLVFTGDAGVGKSALLEYAVRRAADRAPCVLRASGAEFEAAVSFSTLQQLLLPVLDRVEELPPAHQIALRVALGFEAGPSQAFAQVRDAAVELASRLVGQHPTLLVVDDLQWVDRSSAAVVSAMVHALHDDGLSLVGASRSLDGANLVTAGEDAIRVMALDPLSTTEAETLLIRAYPDVASTVRARVLREAQGNPLALLELPRLLSGPQRQGVEPLPARLHRSGHLGRVFEVRVGALPVPTRHLLLLVALEPTIDMETLETLLGAVPADVAQPAVEAGLAWLGPGGVRVRHPLVNAAVAAAATPEEKADAHGILGRAAARRGSDLAREAWHLAEAATGPDERVASLLECAAAAAQARGDCAAAMTLLTRSAQLSVDPDERTRRLARAAIVGANVDLPSAEQIIRSLQTADPSWTGSLTMTVAAVTVMVDGDGDVDIAHRSLLRAIDAYPNRTDPRDETLLEAINALRWVARLAGRTEFWDDYRAVVRRLDPGPAPLIDIADRAWFEPTRLSRAALHRVDDAIRGLELITDPETIVLVTRMALPFDRVAECVPALDRLVKSASSGGSVRAGIWALLQIGMDAFHRGRWSVTETAVLEATRLGKQSAYSLLSLAGDCETALIAAARGDEATVARLVVAVARWALPRRANSLNDFVRHVETFAAVSRGDFEQAFQRATAIRPTGSSAPPVWMSVDTALDLVVAAVRTQRLDFARAHVAAMVEIGYASLSTRAAMIDAACRALVAEPADATALFEQALLLPGVGDWRFDHARVQLLYGCHLRRNRAVRASRAPLRAALAVFEDLEAEAWAEQARRELAATAEIRAASVESGRLALQARGLTPQELEIAELAASGLSNKSVAQRLGISHRTVGNHLYQVYAKLGIASRAALRDALSAYFLPADLSRPRDR